MERKEYLENYHKEKLARVPLNIPKEKYDDIRNYCKDHGETVQGMLKRLITEETGIDLRMNTNKGED